MGEPHGVAEFMSLAEPVGVTPALMRRKIIRGSRGTTSRFSLFLRGGIRYDLTARAADRAVPVELIRFLAVIHIICASPARRNPLRKRVDELEAEVARLEKQLATAETILEVQGKVAGLLGLSFDSGKNS